MKGGEERFLVLSSLGLVSFQDKPEAEEAVWRFDPQPSADFGTLAATPSSKKEVRTVWKDVPTDTAFTRVPVQETFEVEKTPEMKAQEAAELILKARRERFNISTGNTDATFSGEALGAALAELDRIEREYLTLFTGYTVTREQHGSFDVVPSVSARKQQYQAFRLSDKDGLVQEGAGLAGDLSGAPFQGIQDLLAGGLNHRQGVAGGMDLQDVVPGDIAPGNADPDTAADHKADFGAGLIAYCVRTQIAQVGLGTADHADGLPVFI